MTLQLAGFLAHLSCRMHLSLFFIIILCGCQTLGNDEEAKKQAEILNTQKSVIISFLNKGMPSMALKDLRKLIEQYPEDADFKNLMGLTQLALGNPKASIPFFKDAMKIEPRPSISLNLSSAYIESGETERAVAVLTTMLQSPELKNYAHPERVHHNLALAWEKGKKLDESEKQYKTALANNPDFYISLMRLGQLYERTKRPKLARAQFERARKICDPCFDPVNALAMNQLAEGKAQVAIKLVKSYLANKEIAPQDRLRAIRVVELAQKASSTKQAE